MKRYCGCHINKSLIPSFSCRIYDLSLYIIIMYDYFVLVPMFLVTSVLSSGTKFILDCDDNSFCKEPGYVNLILFFFLFTLHVLSSVCMKSEESSQYRS
jgi:hypothetical protein